MPGAIDKISVANRVVMITGAGQGIGRVYAREFARAGAKVGIAELNAENGAAVAREIVAEGGRAVAVQTDVGSPDSVRAAVARINAELGRVEILINNAAIFVSLARRPFDEIPFDEWEQVMRVNVTGSWVCASAVAPGMRAAGWGRIINISSSTVPLGLPLFMHYVTSKAAVIGLTKAIAVSYAEQGVRCNCICPGWVDTPLNQQLAAELGGMDKLYPIVKAQQPLGRMATTREVGYAVLFLASDEASAVTGSALYVDGASSAAI